MTGRENEVEAGLKHEPGVLALTRCKEGNYDFLIKFESPGFTAVDDFLQTYVRRLSGVAGVEIIVDWANHPQTTRDAKAKLG